MLRVIEDTKLTNIADAIREKQRTEEQMTVDMMPDAIRAIQGGSVDEGYLIRLMNGTLTAEDKLPDGITEIRFYAFTACTSLALTTLPEGVTSIGGFAFSGCTSLAITTLPEGVTSIGGFAFADCTSLALTTLPEGVTSIEMGAFDGCTSLEKLTFKGTPTTISANAFNGCTNLKTINVPWAEGAVAKAPWGATNAVINYNYTGD